jgi:glutathione peroxidase
MTRLIDFSAVDIAGKTVSLKDYLGKVVLIVNTASKCGFTPQYEGLEALYKALAPRGFAVLGFPCNQFAGQEPGAAAQIAEFCKLTYDVTFPMFAKIDVNGPSAHPLYAWLRASAPGLLGTRSVKWNFTKFLIDRTGRVVRRYPPQAAPEGLRRDIEALLG